MIPRQGMSRLMSPSLRSWRNQNAGEHMGTYNDVRLIAFDIFAHLLFAQIGKNEGEIPLHGRRAVDLFVLRAELFQGFGIIPRQHCIALVIAFSYDLVEIGIGIKNFAFGALFLQISRHSLAG